MMTETKQKPVGYIQIGYNYPSALRCGQWLFASKQGKSKGI